MPQILSGDNDDEGVHSALSADRIMQLSILALDD
jgi:hypothetical protein